MNWPLKNESLFGNDDAVETWSDTSADKVAERLAEAGYDEDKARRYGEVLETAGNLIVAEVDDEVETFVVVVPAPVTCETHWS